MQSNEERILKAQISSPLLICSAQLYEHERRPFLPSSPDVNWLRPATAFLQFAAILISISPHHDISSRLQKKLELLSLKRKSTPTLMRETHQRRCDSISDSRGSSKISYLLSALCMMLIGALL